MPECSVRTGFKWIASDIPRGLAKAPTVGATGVASEYR